MCLLRGELPSQLEIRQNDFRSSTSIIVFVNNQPDTRVTLDRNVFPSGPCGCIAVPVNGVELKIRGTKAQLRAHALEHAEKESETKAGSKVHVQCSAGDSGLSDRMSIDPRMHASVL